MKKTLTYFSILIAVLAIPTLCWYFMEYKPSKQALEVSTLEELKSANQKIILKNDIDCNYETISALTCTEIDGQGFTIKNCVVTADGYYNSASLFSKGTGTIKNLNLDNIIVKGSNGMGAAVVCVAGVQKIENVHVKNSKVSCGQCLYGTGYGRTVAKSYIGGIYGGYWEKEEYFDCEIINCSVEGLEIEITGYKNSGIYADMFAGGIAGGGNKISGCSAIDCQITATATSIYGEPHVGAIVGISKGTVENSFSKNCKLTANAERYQENVFSFYSTSNACIGGIAGEATNDGTIKYCYSESNNFQANSSGDLQVGGLVGDLKKCTLTQSYAKSNLIVADKYIEGNKNSVERKVGGLVGSAKNSTISSCFAYNDNQFIEKSSGFKYSTDSKLAGLIASVDSVSVMNCATFNKGFQFETTITTDEFIPDSASTAGDCYVSAINYGNISNCEVLSEEFWVSPNLLQDKLNLIGIYWNFTAGELPFLKI